MLWVLSRCGLLAQPPRPVQRILFIGYAAIGDFIFLLPTLAAIRRQYPQARITLLANAYPTTQELAPATGLIDDIWLHDWEGPDAFARQAKINRLIRRARFDLAFLSLSAPAHYFQWGLRGIPLRAGHCRDVSGNLRGLSWPRDAWRWLRWSLITGELARRALLNRTAWIAAGPEHQVRRNIRLLESLDIAAPDAQQRPALPINQAHRDFARRRLAELDPSKSWIGVHLGTPWSAYHKNWDPARFGQLCQRLLESWPCELVCVGSPGDRTVFVAAQKTCPELRWWLGGCALLETYALIERCDLFLNTDSGLAVAAMALGIPTATIFGPADPEEVGPIWKAERHLVVRKGIPCSPCVRLGMAKTGPGVINYLTCGHHDCLRDFSVDAVFTAIQEKYATLLDSDRRARAGT